MNFWTCLLASTLLFPIVHSFEPPGGAKNTTRLPPCRACKTLVTSFEEGLKRTSKYKFEGGDAAWEEENLGSYATSELRLVEIHEKLCSEVKVGKEQCYELLERFDDDLEEWWFKKQQTEPDLLNHLCITKAKVCCPDLHFGPDCEPCPGHPDQICNNNGKCKGSGTRKGDGKCHCDQGYNGDFCEKCSKNFYESYRDDKKFLCSECYIACDGSCTKAGPTGCEKCKNGWTMDKEKGCLDINECASKKSPCTPLQFCINNNGGYKCMDCDRSCAGCTGDGPDMCINCATGYYRNENNICVDATEESRKTYAYYTRYITYFGLCAATCIILNKNVWLAGFIGMCVGIYIYVAEVMLKQPPNPKGDVGNMIAEQVMKAFN